MPGLSPIARRVKNLRRTATRMTVPIGVTALMMATAVHAPTASNVASAVRLAASTACTGTSETKCALIIGGTTVPTPMSTWSSLP
jgi:hypothetical protein